MNLKKKYSNLQQMISYLKIKLQQKKQNKEQSFLNNYLKMKQKKKEERAKLNKLKLSNMTSLEVNSDLSPSKFNFTSFGNFVTKKANIPNMKAQTFDFTTKSIHEIPACSIKSNYSREAELIRNLDLDLIYNTSFSNINEKSMVIDLNSQLMVKYDRNTNPNLSTILPAHSIMNRRYNKTRVASQLKYYQEGVMSRKTNNYMSHIITRQNFKKNDRSSRSNISDRVNMVSQYDNYK